MQCRVTPWMCAKQLRGHLLHQKWPSRKGEKAGMGGSALGTDTTGAATRDCTAAMRARAKGSLFTKCMVGDGPETGAGTGGDGLPRQVGPEKSENGRERCPVVRHLVSARCQCTQQTTYKENGGVAGDASSSRSKGEKGTCVLACDKRLGWRHLCQIWPGCGTCNDLCAL